MQKLEHLRIAVKRLLRDDIGNALLDIEETELLCSRFGIPTDFHPDIIFCFRSREEFCKKYGDDYYSSRESGTTIELSDLSYHIAKKFGLGLPGVLFSMDKGLQLRANAVAIKHYVQEMLDIKL